MYIIIPFGQKLNMIIVHFLRTLQNSTKAFDLIVKNKALAYCSSSVTKRCENHRLLSLDDIYILNKLVQSVYSLLIRIMNTSYYTVYFLVRLW